MVVHKKGVKHKRSKRKHGLDSSVWAYLVLGIVILGFVLIFIFSGRSVGKAGALTTTTTIPENTLAACSDGISNDGDTKIDYADSDCKPVCAAKGLDIIGFYSGYGIWGAYNITNNTLVDGWNLISKGVNAGCCDKETQCFQYSAASKIGTCYNAGQTFTLGNKTNQCTVAQDMARWCYPGSVIDTKGNCLMRIKSGEFFSFGNDYYEFGDIGLCGDAAGEYQIITGKTTKCCHFLNSIIQGDRCIQNDGRNANKYIKMNITLGFDNNGNSIYFCTNPIVISFNSSLYTFKDNPYQPPDGIKLQVINSTNVLNEQIFEFNDLNVLPKPRPECFIQIDGSEVLDNSICPIDLKEVLEMPCYASATKIRILNENNSLACEKNIGGLCS